ncbi:MAG: hypothetical protein ACLP6E_17630 [Acidimicrobiales bacterium]
MHPIEMLRAVARSRRGPPGELAAEAAWGLAALAEEEPAAVLPACRRLLERQPACGPLWWLSARVLVAGDPAGEAERCASLLIDDPTPDVVRSSLRTDPDSHSLRVVRQGGVGDAAGADVVIIEVDALSMDAMLVSSARRGLLQAAMASETPVWVESGVGRLLPPKLWSALVGRVTEPGEPGEAGGPGGPGGPRGRIRHELGYFLESTDCAELILGPSGTTRTVELGRDVAAVDCPEPPELTAPW